jgi:hypothetical protein
MKSRFDIIWPTMKKTLTRGEPVLVAIRLINSETGVSSVRLEPMVYLTRTCSSVILPTSTAEISIRHIGDATNRLSRAFNSASGSIDPFIEMLNESYSDSIVNHFNDTDQMYGAIKRAFSLGDSTIKRIKDCIPNKETRADVIESLSAVSNDISIEDGETLQRAAGIITVKGWKYLKRFMTVEE